MARLGMDPNAWIEEFSDEFEAFNTTEIIAGLAVFNSREFAVYAHDPRAGFITSAGASEILSLMEKAQKKKIPIISFMASAGVSVEEGLMSGDAYTKVIAKTIELSGYIPQIAVIMGTTMGAPAYSATLMDFVIMNKARSGLMVTGPAVIEKVIGQKTTVKDLGGAEVHSKKTGISDHVAKNLGEQINWLKELSEYLPSSTVVKMKNRPSVDPLNSITLPTGPRQPYDIREFFYGIIDGSHFFEIKADFAKSLLTGFARIDGELVAIIANQSTFQAGALDYQSARKAARFIRMTDSFNIPLLNIIDVPGFMPGELQEHNGLLRYGAQMCQSMHTTTPRLSVVVRRCYGAAAFLMMQTKSQGGEYVMALKGSSVAIMGYEGAKTMIYPDDKVDRSQEYYEQYEDPMKAKDLGIIDEVVEPSEVRALLMKRLKLASEKDYKSNLNKKHVSLI